MKNKILLVLVSFNIIFCSNLLAQSSLIKNIKNGIDQFVVVYGTSLSSDGCGKSWMEPVKEYFNQKYGNHLSYCLAGRGGKWSTWGVQHLEDSVISKRPDAVIIEFGINDAFEDYKTSPQLARLNLEYMIDRIQLYNPNCEIILQVMNMPIDKPASFRPNLIAYYSMYREVAKKRNLLLIDHYPNWEKILFQGKNSFLKLVPDGIHPNEEGGKSVIAPMIIKMLEISVETP